MNLIKDMAEINDEKNNFSFLKENNFMLCEKIFTFKNIGKRKIQEDDIFICDIVDVDKTVFNSLFIFDGHGANEKTVPLPEFIIKNNILFNELKKYFKTKKVTVSNIKNFFLYFDNFLENKIDHHIGSCLSGVMVAPDFIYTISLGDTSIKIYDSDNNLFFKTVVHNFNNNDEICRYREMNQDSFIKNNRYKGLLMSRTLGDFDCKTIGERCLLALPDVKKIYNNKNFVFLLHTDGIVISGKTLLNKYHEGIIDKYLSTKKFSDNASLIIFKNTFSRGISIITLEKENCNNSIFLEFLKYIHD